MDSEYTFRITWWTVLAPTILVTTIAIILTATNRNTVGWELFGGGVVAVGVGNLVLFYSMRRQA